MKCELCGYFGQMLPKFQAKEIFECPRCGLIFYAGNAGSELYSREYFEGGEYHDYRGDERVIRRNFRKQIRKAFNLRIMPYVDAELLIKARATPWLTWKPGK